MNNRLLTYAVILGGGKGARLYAITAQRAKPAVPIFGTNRLIDFPMSNCKRSEISLVDILTQYEPASLNKHLRTGIPWDYNERTLSIHSISERRGEGFIRYKGTADAVRTNIRGIKEKNPGVVLILSGDHVYAEDYRKSIEEHLKKEADLTVYTKVVLLEEAPELGVMKVNKVGRIVDFKEKPKDPSVINDLKLSDEVKQRLGINSDKDLCLASMGVYVFSPDKLYEQLNLEGDDFGRDVIPRMVSTGGEVHAYVFQDYWEDVGRLDKLIDVNFYAINKPVDVFNQDLITNTRILPPPVIQGKVINSIISPGCIIHPGAVVENSVIGYQTIVEPGAVITNCILHGGDRHDITQSGEIFRYHYSFIRKDSRLEYVLLDREVDIEEGVHLIGKQDHNEMRKALEGAGLQENCDEHPTGMFNISDNGLIVIGKPYRDKEKIFEKGYKI